MKLLVFVIMICVAVGVHAKGGGGGHGGGGHASGHASGSHSGGHSSGHSSVSPHIYSVSHPSYGRPMRVTNSFYSSYGFPNIHLPRFNDDDNCKPPHKCEDRTWKAF